jgi:hypothetical protein
MSEVLAPILAPEVLASLAAPANPMAVRRMGRSDLDELRPWLVGRLRERHTEATPGMVMGWLLGCLANNEYWFVRSGKAVALAQLVTIPLEPQPVAAEIFLLHQEGGEEQAAALYPAMASWAAHQNASRLEVMAFTDLGRVDVSMMLARGVVVHSRKVSFVRLGRLI